MNDNKIAITARIYNESKACTQSGKRNQNVYILEFLCPDAKYKEPLMGWIGSKSTCDEIKIKFSSLESAIRFANEKKLNYEILKSNVSKFVPKRYFDNFK